MLNETDIAKVRSFDVPPPGPGLFTVTLAVPAVSMSPAEMEAVNFVELLKVVVRSDPFHRTLAAETKLEPFTVRVNPGSPATAELGLIPVTDGTGLLILSVNFLLVLPPTESRT
jgi:hypothetical protein